MICQNNKIYLAKQNVNLKYLFGITRRLGRSKCLLHTANILSLIPDPQWKERTDSPKLFSDLHIDSIAYHVHTYAHMHTYTHIPITSIII